MFLILVLLFTVLPLVELALLFRIGAEIGAANTVSLVLITGILGAWLARHQGVRTLRAIQTQMAQGQMPGAALFDGALILLAGALLVTPGVLTDVIGFSFLFPPLRALLRRGLSGWAQDRVQLMGQVNGQQPFAPGGFQGAGPFPGSVPIPGAIPFPGADPYGPEVVRDVEAEVRDVQAEVRDT